MGGEEASRLRRLLGHLALLGGLTAYTVLGGVVFRELEYPGEVARLAELDSKLRRSRNHLLQTLVEICSNASSSTNTASYIEKQLAAYEVVVEEAGGGGLHLPLEEVTAPGELARWNTIEAIFFASTVLTTIGYGNIVPVTLAGRGFCVVYALVGIPLALTVIADVGCLLAASLPTVPDWSGPGGGAGKSLVSALGALGLLLVYLAIGGGLFILLEEEWSFFESFYFSFITMTTIGFGDLVPQKPEYMLLCTLYILVGLSLTSTIIELVRLEYVKSWERLQALAEALAKLRETGTTPTGGELSRLQEELAEALSRLPPPRTRPRSLLEAPPQPPQPPPPQIVVYETSV